MTSRNYEEQVEPRRMKTHRHVCQNGNVSFWPDDRASSLDLSPGHDVTGPGSSIAVSFESEATAFFWAARLAAAIRRDVGDDGREKA